MEYATRRGFELARHRPPLQLLSLSRGNHFQQLGCRGFNVDVAILASSRLHSKHPTAMNVFEIAIGKFVSSLGVLSVTIVDSQVPLCIFAKAMLSNELILELSRGPIFGPSAFAVCDNMSFFDESRGERGCVLI
jgi:hypothetical protein